MSPISVTSASDVRVPGYGRARLRLGISAVGSMVLLTTGALVAGLPAAVDTLAGPGHGAAVLALAFYSASHAAIQLPFDLFGGHLLAVKYGRSRQELGIFLGRLLRGMVVYAGVLFVGLFSPSTDPPPSVTSRQRDVQPPTPTGISRRSAAGAGAPA